MSDAKNKVDRSILHLPFEPGVWADCDDVMFEACFCLLGDYVEDELGREPWDFEGGRSAMHRGYRLHAADLEAGEGGVAEARPSTDRAAIDLWLWYKEELPELERACAADAAEAEFPHGHVEGVKDAKLRALMDLRRSLWT